MADVCLCVVLLGSAAPFPPFKLVWFRPEYTSKTNVPDAYKHGLEAGLKKLRNHITQAWKGSKAALTAILAEE